MPITGTFLADFTQFDSAVQGAGAKLRAFEGDAGKTSGALQSMETSSQTLSTRMLALGSAVGAFVGAFAFSAVNQGISALISMGQEAFTSAGRILDLSNKTGLSTESIQRMQFVADQTGGSLEQFTQAAFMLGTRLSGGSGSVQKAVEELGVSFQALQQMRPDQQFDTVVAALGRMDDATKRNELGLAIFDRSFATIAAAVAEGYGDIASAASVSSEAQLKSIERANDAWNRFVRNMTTGVTSAMGDLILAFEKAQTSGDGYAIALDGYAGELRNLVAVAKDIQLTTDTATTSTDSYAVQLAKAKAEVAGLDTETRKEIEAAKQLGVSTDDLTAKFGISEEALRLITGEMTKLKTETDKVDTAIKRMTDSQKTYLDIVLPGTSKAAELERSRAEQAGQHAKFTAEGLKTLTFLEEGLGAVQDSRATGALAIHLAEQTAIREQQEALALVEQQTKDNYLEVGNYATANKMAGEAAKAATDQAIQGYAAVGQQVTLTGDAIRAYIELQKYSAAANAILQENTLFTSRSQLERISKLPMGGGNGGGGITVNVNASNSFLNTPADTQRLAETVGNSVKSQLMGNGRQVT